jgi:hypothetical protein
MPFEHNLASCIDPPQPPLKRGEKTLKVPLEKGDLDLGGSAQIQCSRMSLKHALGGIEGMIRASKLAEVSFVA